MEKFYVIVRADLPPGLQIAQACHAAYLLGLRSPKESRENIAVLAIPNKEQLLELVAVSAGRGDVHQPFFEPDLGGEITACSFDALVKKRVRRLPTALKNQASVPVST